VIGVLARKGQTAWGQDQDDVVLMPFLTAERRVLGTKILGTVDMIVVSTMTADALPKVEEQVRRLLHERHRIPPGQDDDFTVRDLNEIAEASKKAREVMTNLLLSVASVSLLVGGIGIMNIMLVSVTERTREIGVRLAVGARTGHILLQFLVEATALSLVGGAAGVSSASGRRGSSRASPSGRRSSPRRPPRAPSWSRARSASSSASTRRAGRRAWIRSRRCATSEPRSYGVAGGAFALDC
jgi:putative ABC transport system permease protein